MPELKVFSVTYRDGANLKTTRIKAVNQKQAKQLAIAAGYDAVRAKAVPWERVEYVPDGVE